MPTTRDDRPGAWTPEVEAAEQRVLTVADGLISYAETKEIPGHLILDRDDRCLMEIFSQLFRAASDARLWRQRYGMQPRSEVPDAESK